MQRTPTCENCLRNFELRDCRPTGNRIPLLLPCGHTFCEGCLLKAAKNSTEISCFNCEEKVQFHKQGEAGVKTLLPNIYLLGLLLYNRRIASDKITGGAISAFNGIGNIISKSNSSFSDTGQSTEKIDGNNVAQNELTITCDECNLKTATCQCDGCECRYCEGCFKQVHKTSKLLMKHIPMPLDVSRKDQQLCLLHDRKLEFYDKDTSEAVCAICIISERCRGHDVILLSEVSFDSHGIDNVVDKAKDTLHWWQHSSKVLTEALPEEYMEAAHLFDDIQSKFNTIHTILLKRQLEMMIEASDKLVASGSIQEKLQDLNKKTGSLGALLEDVEMIMKDKNILTLKSDEYINKLNEYIDLPCIIKRTAQSEDDGFKLNIEDGAIASIKGLGEIENRLSERFKFLKPDELSEELKEKLKSGLVDEDIEVVQVDELSELGLDKRVEKPAHLADYNELVCVTDVTNPADFKVQRLSDKDRLQVLMTDLNKYCRYANSSENLVHAVEEGQLVCAQFLADNNWYRGRVTNKFSPKHSNVQPSWSNGVPVEITYIDYGNTEWLPLTRLRVLPNEFLGVAAMAVRCTLANISPPCESKKWPDRSKKAFTSLTGDRPMLMSIHKRIGCILHVDLRKPDDDEPTRDDDRPTSVRDALVFLEVAVSKSSTSITESKMHQPLRKYKPHESLVEGEFNDMTVTHIEDPDAIYIQKLNSQIADEQSRLGIIYNSKNKKSWMIDYPHKNLVCSAKFSIDKAWYRAKVLNVYHDDTVEVEYVDYGNREKLRFSELRRIPDMYLELPQQCIKVKLHGVTLPKEEENWSDKIKEFLHKFFLGKPLVTVVRAFEDDVPIVEFYDTSTDVDIKMNELISKFLIKAMNSDPVEDSMSQVLSEISDLLINDEKIEVDDKQKFLNYLPPVIPDSTRFPATGVHVDDEANIYIHVMDSDNSCVTEIINQLNHDAERFEKGVKTIEKLVPKQAVVAKFSQDQLWYRGEVVAINENCVRVKYIDFGNLEDADILHIFPEPMFLEIPAQSISVRLHGVEPVAAEWPTEAISLLREYVVSEVVGVELKEKNGKELSAVIYGEDGSNINDILVRENLVKVRTMTNVIAGDNTLSSISSKGQEQSGERTDEDVHTSDYLWFSEQRLPKEGLKFDVMVTQVNQPDIIYIQRLPLNNDGSISGDLENDESVKEAYNNLLLLESFSEIINTKDYFDGSVLNVKPIVGMSCIGKYTSDSLYYRAKVERLEEDQGLAEVVYVDYGTSEYVPIESLIPLPPGLINLPMQAKKVCLAGLKPYVKTDEKGSETLLKDTNWSIESMKEFYSIVANKRLVAEVINVNCDIPKIHLYERVENDGEVTLVHVGKKMAESNSALFD